MSFRFRESFQVEEACLLRSLELLKRRKNTRGEIEISVMLGQLYIEHSKHEEAVKRYRMAAEQGDASAQFNMGVMLANGQGVTKNEVEAVKYYRLAADQGYAGAQLNLGFMLANGQGVVKNETEAYKWFLLAGSSGNEVARKNARENIEIIERKLTADQRALGQKLAGDWGPNLAVKQGGSQPTVRADRESPSSTGSGFFVTNSGHFITSYHVVENAARIVVMVSGEAKNAKLIASDKANDLSLLHIDSVATPISIASSRSVRLGHIVSTVGFPNVDLLGVSPKYSQGTVSSLRGVQDSPRDFQVSLPIQPGNSGGPLVDSQGNVVGVIASELNEAVTLAVTGSLPENVNYAVKSSYLLSFLESFPEVIDELPTPGKRNLDTDTIVERVRSASALVFVYE